MYSRSASTAPNIGDSYCESIGHTYGTCRHTPGMPNKPPRTAWERVKEALQDAGYKGIQKDVEKICGVQQGSVSEWNTPDGGPSLDNARKLAVELNVCTEWILTEQGPKRPGPPMDAAAQQLWNLWGRIDDGDRQQIVGFAAGKVRPTSATGRS